MRTFKINLLIIGLLLISFGGFSQQQEKVKKSFRKQKQDIRLVFSPAIRGDSKTTLEGLDTMPKVSNLFLNRYYQHRKKKYIARFSTETEKYKYKTKDTVVITIMDYFQDYWKTVFNDKSNIEVEDSLLIEKLTDYFYDNNLCNVSRPEIKDSIGLNINKVLEARGYHGELFIIMGIQDCIIWEKEKMKKYEVYLLEDTVNVSINFLSRFIMKGWLTYSTRGNSNYGGWAAKDYLSCYNIIYPFKKGERFRISYLKHEAQHFSDYSHFPNLSGADLEYRAKLSELTYLKRSISRLIYSFIINSNNTDRSSAHAYANYYLIRDLSQEIFNEDFVSDKQRWKKVSAKKINAASEKLLKQNTEMLYANGAETVEELIK